MTTDAAQRIELTVGPPATGGACAARHEGRVVFVRHALPGERVVAEVTAAGGGGRYWFADTVEVLQRVPGRVEPPCPLSGPGGCGGCDYQHVDPAVQRQWKAGIVAEQLRRLGGVDVDVPIVAVPGDERGLRWRTRVRYAVDDAGRVGFRAHRSRRVIAVDRCRIASRGIQEARYRGEAVTARHWREATEVAVVEHADGVLVSPLPGPSAPDIRETAVGRDWTVAGDGFWQVHPGAADALAGEVVARCRGARAVWDLYAGAGLFAGALAAAEPGRSVTAVEGGRRAAALARRNVGGLAGVRVSRADVGRWLTDRADSAQPDTVVLDPPRKGAGKRVMGLLSDSSATQLVYIACDPAALGRDTALALGAGWTLTTVAALDIFPMTHHVETVAVFQR